MKAVSKKKRIPAGARIRVLVVDDSVVIRRLITHALQEDPGIEVIGSACDGSAALAQIASLRPDLITLDVEMPGLNGIEVLQHLRQNRTDLRVILFSTLTDRGAATTMEGLWLGADDYVTKASNVGALDRSIQSLREELVPKIKQFFEFESQVPGPAVSKARANVEPIVPALLRPRPTSVPAYPKIVVIGVSTGGPTALETIISVFPADFHLPVLIVQHMPACFTRLLAERLQTVTKLTVEEATEGAAVERGKVFIAPGNYHMQLQSSGTQTTIHLDQGPPQNACRPAADVLFRSAANIYGPSVLCVVMTGMGADGLKGAELLKAGGATVIVQDEASSVVWGMAGGVVRAGLADAVLPLNGIVPEIVKRVEQRSVPRVSKEEVA